MKIGAFAQKHGVTIDTVRYYIKLGLLLPRREGLRHNFDDLCHQNMEQIQYYKSLRFSLKEIVRLMSVQYLYNGTYRIKRDAFLTVLKEKSREAEERILKEQRALDQLKAQIRTMETERIPSREVTLPLSVLDLLACPRCGNSFIPSAESRRIGGLRDRISCSCGFGIGIEANILTVDNRELGFRQDDPNGFIVQFLNSGEGGEIVHALDQTIYTESQRFRSKSGNILCFQNLPVIPYYEPKTEGYYILVSDDRDYLNMVYESLCVFGGLEHFILIHCTVDQLPLKKGTIDSIYDFFYTDIASLVYNKRYLENLVPLLSEYGDYLHIGFFTDTGSFNQINHSDHLHYRFYQSEVNREFLSRGLILQESAVKATASFDKLLSKAIMEKVKAMGYRFNQKDRGHIRSQLFVKSS